MWLWSMAAWWEWSIISIFFFFELVGGVFKMMR
jgi:hypothetical protein